MCLLSAHNGFAGPRDSYLNGLQGREGSVSTASDTRELFSKQPGMGPLGRCYPLREVGVTVIREEQRIGGVMWNTDCSGVERVGAHEDG